MAERRASKKRLTPALEVRIRLHTLAQFVSGLWPAGSEEGRRAYETIVDFPPTRKKGKNARRRKRG